MRTKSELNKSGIYKITNKLNKKLYVGSSVNIRKRWKAHRNRLRRNQHPNKHLQSSFNKHGIDVFEFEVLEFIDIPHLIDREQCWMDRYQSYNRKYGYNMSPIADLPRFGCKASKETLKRLSGSHRGNKQTKETKRKISESQYKPVYQIDIDGNIIKRFGSCLEVENVMGISRQNISMACRKKTNYIKGYQWCYVEDIDKFKSKLPKGWKPIAQFDKNGNIIKTWKSIQQAADDKNVDRGTIYRKLKNGIDFHYVFAIS